MGKMGEDDLVYDFVDLKKVVKTKVIDELDHTHLNDRFENPSAEIMAIWIWEQLEGDLKLCEVKLWETSTCFVTHRGSGSTFDK